MCINKLIYLVCKIEVTSNSLNLQHDKEANSIRGSGTTRQDFIFFKILWVSAVSSHKIVALDSRKLASCFRTRLVYF